MASLKSKLPELFMEAYDLALDDAVRETGLDDSVFPKTCERTLEQVLQDGFYRVDQLFYAAMINYKIDIRLISTNA